MTLTQNIAPAKFLDKTYDALKLLILSLKLSLKEFIKIPLRTNFNAQTVCVFVADPIVFTCGNYFNFLKSRNLKLKKILL